MVRRNHHFLLVKHVDYDMYMMCRCCIFLCSSAFAGGVASFVTSPLDMAKLRLQVPSLPPHFLCMLAVLHLYDKYMVPQVQRSQQAIMSLAPPPTDGVAAGHYTSFWDALVKTFKGEGGAGNRGLRALYRGAMARVS